METTAALKMEESPGAGSGLVPETVLPAQFYDGVRIDASLQAEKRLMLAVLEDAVGTFQKYTGATGRRAQRLFAEVEEWFASDDTDWPFTFVNICEALGLEPHYVRRGLSLWRDRQRSAAGGSSNVVRFPFRRVNGRRHSITGRPVGLRRTA